MKCGWCQTETTEDYCSINCLDAAETAREADEDAEVIDLEMMFMDS